MYTQAIRFHANSSPEAIAISLFGTKITYARFDSAINAMARGLQDALPQSARVVGVHRSGPYLDWLFTLALGRIDKVAVSVPAGPFPAVGFEFVDCLVSTDKAIKSDTAQVRYFSKEQLGEILSKKGEPIMGAAGVDDPALITMTSGTTGVPKAIQITHGTIVSRLKSGIFGSAMRHDTLVCVELPISTFGGFGVPVRTWYLGGTVFLGAITQDDLRHGHVRTFVTTPGGLNALVSKFVPGSTPIEGLCVVVGGGALSPALMDRVHERLTKNLIMTYGSTETTTAAVSRASSMLDRPGLTGVVLPWVDVEIVGEDERPLPYGEVGEVRIRNGDMVHGYLGDAEASAKVFRGGWFYPGDIGSLDQNGSLSIVGRADYLLNLNGYKIAPERIEQVLSDLPGLVDVAATGTRNAAGMMRAVILVVTGEGFDPQLVALALARELPGLTSYDIQLVDRIPRNEMTKVERQLLQGLVQKLVEPAAKASGDLAT